MKALSSTNLLAQVELPVIAAPMFLVSSPALVMEACKAGVIGSFPLLNARTNDILKDWMEEITEELKKASSLANNKKIAPWAVNLIVHKTNKRLEEDVALIKKYKPPIIITSLGNPKSIVRMVHEYGGLVFSDVSTLAHAKKAAETGVDGLILVCNGAGGHAGMLNPMAFLGAVRKFWKGITILSGSITTGADILAAQILGADFAYMGTRFIPTTESFANEQYKKMIVEASVEDIVYTDAFSGIHANYLIPSIRKAGLDPSNLKKKETIDFSEMANVEVKAWRDIWSAGQGISSISKIASMNQVIVDLKEEYKEAAQSIINKIPNKLLDKEENR